MKTVIVATEAIKYAVDLRRLDAVPGDLSLTISSVWPGAKDPAGEHVLFQICIDRAGLLALRDLIDAEVQS